MDRKAHINFWYFAVAIIGIMLFQQAWIEGRQLETIPYSEFQQLLQDEKIAEITIADTNIRGKLKEVTADGHQYIYTVRVDPDFANDLAKYKVKFSGIIDSKLMSTLLSWLIPMALFFVVWMFLVRKMADKQGGGLLSIGKSKAKIFVEKDMKTTFDAVAGVDEAKEELKEIVAFLKNPKDYGRIGAHVPKGILLIGPPGTGKTMLARAVAGEASVPFFSINGSEFVEMFVGVGAARVRDLFEQAHKSSPCIIFIDELDALGRARGAGPLSGGHDEKEQTLNQLLSELDGFDPQQGIVLLAATNRPEILDPALLRAGRFDRQILVDRPDKVGRTAILNVHVKAIKMDADVVLEQIAALTTGFSGADLANLVNEAAILATRRDAASVTMDDFTRAIERIVAGLEKKNRLLNPHEREVVAYHETGHALVTLALPGTDKVHKVSIIPRGIGALGYNIQRPTEDRYLMTSVELENKMAGLLGGRAAEMVVFKELSTGAANDLDKATDIARNMVMRYGMDEILGQATYAEEPSPFLAGGGMPRIQPRSYSEKTAREIDEAVRTMVGRAFGRATAILKQNRQLLNETSEKLLQKETLTAAELPQPVWPVQGGEL
ncbi:membrane protease FtsH catalytic subunit [Desulfuromusa kysingii]|uniref:ATP-dependent zinc metalloprotease FtsH n=1 Tax=Desulfuromusa kysingii TaxID=37625 RepID=A0A1H3ZTP6_9BACT|nr:ATP-dependent zinc metalloprotease FtsH [Desulfuromusa kysingii]SEA27058.1 membrane protease FtsH catalytic subunit [Desulfuromusa kysingii]